MKRSREFNEKGVYEGICEHCGKYSYLLTQDKVSGFSVTLCEMCWGPFFELLARFTPHKARAYAPSRR